VHYSLFVVRNVGTARFDTLVSTRSTRQTCRVVSRRDVTSQMEFGLFFRLHKHTAISLHFNAVLYVQCNFANLRIQL